MVVVLLRGVNVSGANKLPMAAFRSMLADLGFGEPRTYIQSGNAVFATDLPQADVARLVGQGIADRFGFSPDVLVRTADDIALALTDHPFAAADPARVHVVFLDLTPAALDEEALKRWATQGETWHLAPGRFTLHTPAGFGTSKLAERLGRVLPAPMTARNLRTVAALVEMTKA